MSGVTDADRDTAMFALFPELAGRVDSYIGGLTFSDEAEANMQAIAVALAEEREKARAPFRKLADAIYDGWHPSVGRLADAIYAYTGGYGRDRASEENA